MVDVRENILARLVEVVAGIPGIKSAQRDNVDITEEHLPVAMVFDGDEYSFQAGGGIVADSVTHMEYQEVLAKSAILRRALELAEEGL